MPTVLVGPGTLRGKPGRFREILRAAGFDEFIDLPGDHALTFEELRETMPTADAMLAGGERVTEELLAMSPKLRAIARTGVGYDSIDIAAATAHKVPVIITPGTNQGSVAEQTFGLLLALTRDIVNNDARIKSGGWSRELVRPLRDSTIGLIGLGRIGRAVATRAIAFGMKVIAYDPVADPQWSAQHGITHHTLDEILAESDVVSLHLPLSSATANLFDRAAFAKMKPGAIFLNTSRGGLVVEADLLDALVSGHLFGAGLDVFQTEPTEADNPLLKLKNVVVSPHIAGIDTKGMADMANLASQCIVDLKQGRWPGDCIVNKEIESGWTW